MTGIDAAFIRLEPLAAHEAVAYIQSARSGLGSSGPDGVNEPEGHSRMKKFLADSKRVIAATGRLIKDPVMRHRDAVEKAASDAGAPKDVDPLVIRVARNAEVMERPLYLKLARDLFRHGKLGEISSNKPRVRVRFELLDGWRELLVTPQLHDPDVWIEEADCEQAVELTEKLACVALAESRLEIDFPAVVGSLCTGLDNTELPTTKLLLAHAEHLDLVEIVGQKVRFRHSILQAYLGARRLRAMLEDDGSWSELGQSYLREALKEPGREVTMALVMLCLVKEDTAGAEGRVQRLCEDAARAEGLVQRLCEAATSAQDHHSFELLAAAYEIDTLAGGRSSQLLKDTACDVWSGAKSRATDVETTEAKLAAILPIAKAGEAGDPRAYQTLWEVCAVEDQYAVRFQAAQVFASGGNRALEVVRTDVESAVTVAKERLAYRNGRAPQPEWEDVRKHALLGWVMPLLAVTCDQSGSEPIREAIASWVEVASGASPKAPGLHLGTEAALAHGFEWAANRRAKPDDCATARAFLIEQALALLKKSGWWQTRITLLQALTLWGFDSDKPQRAEIRCTIERHRRRSEHAFVREAASLCRDALRPRLKQDQRQRRRLHAAMRRLRMAAPGRPRGPSRHIWIDEVGVIGKIGPQDVPSDEFLHIPPWVGWHALSERARQLVAEVVVFLNLIEGRSGSTAADQSVDARNKRIWKREERRFAAYRQGVELPPCLKDATKRRHLCVDGVKTAAEAGEDGKKHDTPSCKENGCENGCPFELCPYPPRDDAPFRGELPEIFCREQERLVRGPRVRLPPGEERTFARRRAAKHLMRFWESTEKRDQRQRPTGVAARAEQSVGGAQAVQQKGSS